MQKPYEPSKLEISNVCRDIQEAWSQTEELRRRCAVDQVWHPPKGVPMPDTGVKAPTQRLL